MATHNRRPHYEEDAATFSAEAYTVAGWGAGIAFWVYGSDMRAAARWAKALG